MNFKKLLKDLPQGGSVTLLGGKSDKIIIERYGYVYAIKLNKCSAKDFLLNEAARWLDFYESKRGYLRESQPLEEVQASVAMQL